VPHARFFEHDGHRILRFDFARIAAGEEALAAIAEAKASVSGQAPGSLLVLTDVTGSRFDATILAAIRDLMQTNAPYIRASAVVGLSGLQRVVYSSLVRLTRRNVRAFDDEAAALDWLASQA
jgi:hypothetical protein